MSNLSWIDNNTDELEHRVYVSTGLIQDNVTAAEAYMVLTGNTLTASTVTINEEYFDARSNVTYNSATGVITIPASTVGNLEKKGHGFSVGEEISITASAASGVYYVNQVLSATTFNIRDSSGVQVSPAFGTISNVRSRAPFVNYRVAAVRDLPSVESVLSGYWPLFNSDQTVAPRFTFNINVTNNNQVFELPLTSSSICYFAVDWGDGTRTFVKDALDPLLFKHEYKLRGIYKIRIVGRIEGFAFNNSPSAKMLTTIESWGDLKLNVNGNSGSGGYFYGCLNLTTIPTTNLATLFSGTVTDLNFSYFFTNCYKLSVELSTTILSRVVNTAYMFAGCSLFNSDISSWDVSKVVNMSSMFERAAIFNQPLNSWNVSQVTNMSSMFKEATNFNQSINSWNVANVLDMSFMFAGKLEITFSPSATVANQSMPQPLLATIKTYSYTTFNQNIVSWDVSKVTNFSFMFAASSFNQSLVDWKPLQGLDFSYMFAGNTNFNSSLTRETSTGKWAIDKAINLNGMFLGSSSFQGNGVSTWSLPDLQSAIQMFDNSALTQTNYNLLLTTWPGNLTYTTRIVYFSAGIGNSTPNTTNGVSNRKALIDKGWGIRDKSTVSSISFPNGYYNFSV